MALGVSRQWMNFRAIGEWEMAVIAAAWPNMIATLNTLRHTLEDLGGALAVTHAVSALSFSRSDRPLVARAETRVSQSGMSHGLLHRNRTYRRFGPYRRVSSQASTGPLRLKFLFTSRLDRKPNDIECGHKQLPRLRSV
jgi:hypothetical protein